MKIKDLLQISTDIPFLCDAPMSFYTTYRTGGIAEILALPETENQLKTLINIVKEKDITFRVLGSGSNILVSDEGIKGITCCLRNFKKIEIKDNTITAYSGNSLDEVIRFAVKNGLSGLENLSGIPGSIGGAVFMNAGAYNTETFDKLKTFPLLTYEGEIKTLNKEDVVYSYRKVEGIENSIILSATFELTKDNPILLTAKRVDILRKRKEKQPLEFPSAGSVFKRPQGNYASKLIDEAGLKGLTIGGAQVSTKHAGFIINYDNATAKDIYDLICEVQKQVKEKTGYSLELEQILWGKF